MRDYEAEHTGEAKPATEGFSRLKKTGQARTMYQAKPRRKIKARILPLDLFTG